MENFGGHQLELQRNPPKSKPPLFSDSDSDVFESPPIPVKRRKLSLRRPSSGPQGSSSSAEPSWLPKLNEVWEKVVVMSAETTQQLHEVQSLREMLKKQAQIGIKPVTGIFKCIICKSSMSTTTNLVVAPCCQAALACRGCLQEWLNTSDNQTCPHCMQGAHGTKSVLTSANLIAAIANQEEPAVAEA